MRFWGIGFLALVLVGCAPSQASISTAIAETSIAGTATQAALPTATPAATATPTLSPAFVDRAEAFLETGSKVSALTEQGVVFVDFREAVGAVAGALDLLDASWPAGIGRDARNSAADAVEGWQLALELWALDLGDKDNPAAPNINGYSRFLSYGQDALVIDIHPDNYIVVDYRGRQYLPFDENVSVLMGLGSNHYDEARSLLLRLTE